MISPLVREDQHLHRHARAKTAHQGGRRQYWARPICRPGI